jgi:hypothetical protein
MNATDHTQIVAADLADEVEALLDAVEPEATFRNSIECSSLGLLAGAALLSPPTPKPKKG